MARSGASISPLLPVVGGDLQVPLVTGGSVRYANLDYAASAPALASVARAVTDFLPHYSSVHRGAGWASQVSTAALERARRTVSEFVGAREQDVLIFTRNTTDSLNLLATCIPRWGDVIFLSGEHHANLLPWQSGPHRCLELADTLGETLLALERALIDRPAALLAITGASNVTGEEWPINEIVRLAHRHGARVLVDAAQLAPHRRIDMSASGIDYLACSGHKIYAPYGAGVLIGRRDWLDQAPPYLAGGGAVRRVQADRTEWATSPARHEAGSPNVLGAVALAAATQAIVALPEGAMEVHEAALRERLLAGLDALPGITVQRIFADSPSSIGVVTFTVAGYDASLVAQYLSAEHGIGVRDGKFCAHPLLRRMGLPDGAVRASLGLGSCEEDIERLLFALRQLLDIGPQWTYDRRDSGWYPSPDPRPQPGGSGGEDALGSAPCRHA
ncbi:MAG: aminotransferase class V-fold PLP-dependent enzyme [Angustibacter sp.]